MERSSCSDLDHELGNDLKIIINDSVFNVAKTDLVKNCDFFRALFQSGMRECRQQAITLQSVGAPGFLVLLQVLHCERPMLSIDQITEAIQCTAFLQAPALTKHLISIINSENCLLMYDTSATYGVWELFHQSALFIRDMHADLKEDLLTLPRELVEYVESLLPSSYVAVCSHSPINQSSELLRNTQRNVFHLDEEEGEWKVLTHLPASTSTTMAGMAVLNNKLYIIGGVHDVSKRVLELGYCYNPATNIWSTIHGPQQLRYNLTLIGHEGCLYAVGGEYNKTLLSSVERFRECEGGWSFASPLDCPAAAVPSAVTMTRIFICLWRGKGTTDLLEYLPEDNQWLLLTTLTHQSSYALHMVAHRDNLFVMRNGPCGDFLLCMMDCYNLSSGQWTSLSSQYNSLFTAVIKGDSAFTLSRHATTEYAVDGCRWRQKRTMKCFGRIGSIYTFQLRLPKTSVSNMEKSLDLTKRQIPSPEASSKDVQVSLREQILKVFLLGLSECKM